MSSLFDFFSLGGLLRLIGFGVAIAAFVAGPLRSIRARARGEAAAVAPAAPQRMTFLGKVGAMLAMHSVMGVVLGLVSLPFIVAVVRVLCSFALWLCGPADGGPTLWEQVKEELKQVAGAARSDVGAAVDENTRRMQDAMRAQQELLLTMAKEQAAAGARKLKEEQDQAAAAVKEKLEDAIPKPPLGLQAAFTLASMAKSVAGAVASAAPRASSDPQAEAARAKQEERRLWLIETEQGWRSYRESEPLSRMTLDDYRAASDPELFGWKLGIWEAEADRLQHAKWRAWNRGYDFR